jgi:hypothetical protein
MAPQDNVVEELRLKAEKSVASPLLKFSEKSLVV